MLKLMMKPCHMKVCVKYLERECDGCVLSAYAAGRDFVGITNFPITLSPDRLETVITIAILDDDFEEGLEDFTVLLSLLLSEERVEISPASEQVIIIDDDNLLPG